MIDPIKLNVTKTQITNKDEKDILKRNGTTGLKTVQTVAEVIKDYNKSNPGKELKLKYNRETEEFTILNSGTFDQEKLKDLLKEEDYRGWKPELIHVKDSRDLTKEGLGIKLVPILID